MTKRNEKLRAEIERVLYLVQGRIAILGQCEHLAFDEISIGLVSEIAKYMRIRRMDRCYLSVVQLARLQSTTLPKARHRIVRLANYGIIRVVTPWRNDGTGIRANSQITINPLIYNHLIDHTMNTKQIIELAEKLAKLGVDRLNKPGKLQGFVNDCRFGEPEPFSDNERYSVPNRHIKKLKCAAETAEIGQL